MDARSRSAPRSVTEGPSVRSTGGGSGDRTLGDVLVKKWRKRLTEGDAHDSQVLCSRSRAHHTPYFRWDVRVTKRIVEMRVSPPENLKRVPGPRTLLYYLPRDVELQAAQVSLPRSSRTIWKLLHETGCLGTRSKEPPHPKEPRKPLEEIQG